MKRLTTFIILFLLFVPLLTLNFGFVPPAYSQTENRALNVQVGKSYYFVEETVTIKVSSNISDSLVVSIFNPSDVMVFYKTVNPNATVSYDIPLDSEYGLYLVKCEDITTWFWLQKTDELTSVSLPYSWNWKNIKYTLTETYDLQVETASGSFTTEWLSEINAKLKPDNLVYVNDFLVKVESSGKDITATSWMMCQFQGLKIRLNGTLAKETTLKWDFKDFSSEILWTLNSMKLGSLIYDWGDFDRTGVSYTLDKTDLKMDIYLSTSFDIDPVIFEDGFEDGTIDAWDGTYLVGVTLDVSDVQAHHGTYGVRMQSIKNVNEEGFIFKRFTSYETDVYARVYGRMEDLPTALGRFAFGLGMREESPGYSNLAYTIIDRDGTGYRWCVRSDLSGVWVNYYGGYETFYADQWYCIELHINMDGDIQLWVDGVSKVDTSVSTSKIGIQQVEVKGARFDAAEPSDRTVYFDCFVASDSYIGGDDNNAPTNDACSITNLDDTDNLYAQLREYTLTVNVTDTDGYADLDTIDTTIQTGGAIERVTFRFDEDTATFSEQSGDTTKWELVTGSCSNVSSGNTLNMTFVFKAEWDATEESDLDVKVVTTDSASATDTDTYDLNFDVVTNLVVSGFACDDDRGDLSQTITFTGTVYYANNPSSSTATTFYPPDAEFTSVSIYDVANNNEGTDSSIVNGAFSVAFSADATVGIETYNPYINMADADYTDAEETPTDTYISDQIVAYWEQHNDSRVNINDNIEWRIKAVLDYDDTALGSGDGITSSWGAMSWDAGNSWFDISHSEASVTGVTITLSSGSEATYGITSFSENITETTGIYDRVHCTASTASDNRDNINDNVNIDFTLKYDYDEADLTDGSVTIESFSAAHQGSGVWRITKTSAAVTSVTYNEFTATGNTHGITAVDMDGQEGETIVWDRIVAYWEQLDDTRVDIDANIEWRIKAVLDYDDTALSSGDSITSSWGVLSWDAGNSWFDISHTESTATAVTITLSSGTEATYGITTFTENITETTVIFDGLKLVSIQSPSFLDNGDFSYLVQITYAYDDSAIDSGVVRIVHNNGTELTSGFTANATGWATIVIGQTNSSEAGTYTIIGHTEPSYGITDMYENQTFTVRSWTLQARDAASTNLPRSVVFDVDASTVDFDEWTSSTAGLSTTIYAPNATAYTVTTSWGTHTVKSSTITLSANTASTIDTKIQRLSDGSNYALMSLDNTAMVTPTLEGEANILLHNVAATGLLEFKCDHLNWKATTEPTRFEAGTRQYDTGDGTWTWASSIFSLEDTYAGTQDIILLWTGADEGGGGGGYVRPEEPEEPEPEEPTVPPIIIPPIVPPSDINLIILLVIAIPTGIIILNMATNSGKSKRRKPQTRGGYQEPAKRGGYHPPAKRKDKYRPPAKRGGNRPPKKRSDRG